MAATTRNFVLFIIFIAAVVFLEGSVPYWCAEHFAPKGYRFSGQIMYAPDQNMYFSFISQAADGAFLLRNKLTTIPHQPVFLNLEYWLIGYLQRISGLSQNAIYHVWRLLGVILMATGFGMLVRLVLHTQRRRKVAVTVFFLTGGFGFIFALLDVLHLVSFNTLQWGIIDMRFGMLPLQQIITNPHFSFPHGLILIAYAFFVKGEQSGQVKHYIYSGLVFNLIGLVRPYDIIPPVVIFPLYAIAVNVGWRIDIKQWLIRMLPLFMIVPVFLYNVWLFSMHPVFKYWASQGHNVGSLPAIHWHYMVYGVVGLLAVYRLFQGLGQPLGRTGKFVALWFVVTFAFIQIGKVVPALGWSPQIGVYLAAPLTLAACSIQFTGFAASWSFRGVVLPFLAVIIVISNLAVVAYHCRKFVTQTNATGFYTSIPELEAMQWLQQHHTAGSVVMADVPSSQRIARYTNHSVVAAHYSVTPRYEQRATLTARLLADTMITSGRLAVPDSLRVSYLYLKNDTLVHPSGATHIKEVFKNKEVSIYKVR